MAVGSGANNPAARGSGRRMLIGTNVAVMIVIVVALVGVLQAIAYSVPGRLDMTSSRVNSLSEGTAALLRNLDADVRITSFYFKTDLEDEDQPRYRRAVDDLLGLYQSTNRSRIRTDWINPLSDHEKKKRFVAEMRDHPAFRDELAAHNERIEHYRKVLDPRMREVLHNELEAIAAAAGPVQDAAVQKTLGPVEDLLNKWNRDLETARTGIESILTPDNPQDATAVRELKNIYREFSKVLNDVAAYGKEAARRSAGLPPAVTDFLANAGQRYAEIVALIDAEQTALNELKPLKLSDVLGALTHNGNAIVVASPLDVRVVDFSTVWPPIDDNRRGGQAFKDRAFKGEEKLTSAILRATHREQTGVIFVRFGGQPLFFGGFMEGQPPALLAQLKAHLEDLNFIIEEWDLKTSDTPPAMDPKPTKSIYVVLKPSPPDPMMRGQPNQDTPFGESHRKALMSAIEASGRAFFIGGWYPGPQGPGGMILPIPATYEFNEFLNGEFGVSVDTSALLGQFVSIQPGQYGVLPRDPWYAMRRVQLGEHDIVRGLGTQPMFLPFCAPLNIAPTPPPGVEIHRLVILPKADGLWGIKNLNAYEEQQGKQGFLSKAEGDLEGPFDLAVAAIKGNTKIVAISSRDFIADQVAFAIAPALTSSGLVLRMRNPGNLSLMVNALHWLNDNTQYLNVGRPIDLAVLNIPSSGTVRAVQVLTMVIWPALALACGGAVWWVRRR